MLCYPEEQGQGHSNKYITNDWYLNQGQISPLLCPCSSLGSTAPSVPHPNHSLSKEVTENL